MISRKLSHLRTASLLLAGTLLSSSLSAQTLVMSSWVPPTHPLVKDVFKPWTKAIREATDGRVKIRILPKSVGSPPQQYDVAVTKQADIVYGNQSYTAGVFKDYAFSELPFNGDDPVATSVAYWRTYEKFLKQNDELGDVKVLSMFTHGPGQLFTKDITFDSLEADNANAKIRAGGISSARVVDALGATTVQAPLSSAAEMITNGIVNGIALDPMSLSVLHFDKYVNKRFNMEGGIYNVSFFVAMNQETWNSISPEDQQAIEKLSGEALSRKAGEMWKAGGENSIEYYASHGIKSYSPNGQLLEQLKTKLSQYEQQWIAQVEQDGLNGREILDYFRGEVKELSVNP